MAPSTAADERGGERPRDQRIALCLSGGGFRAALFHLGAVRRLNELGVLSRVDLISSVSGGSVLAAHLATRLWPWPAPGAVFADWREKIEAPFHRFVQRNLRGWPLLKRWLLPWNWFRPSVPVRALESAYRKHLTALPIRHLPDRPRFVFCATDMVFGVSWVFERRRVGSYQAGYATPAAEWPLARAVAASSCFPPVFSPLPIELEAGQNVVGGRAGDEGPLDSSSSPWAGMSVSDGGLYDNLGLQPVERYGTVLASDGGQPFVPAVPRGLLGRVKAYLAISGKQAGSLRKRLLIAQLADGVKEGTYWGIGGGVRRYRPGASMGYQKNFATATIARIRTDLDAFTAPEIAVLMNHGYLLADVAIATHAGHLIGQRAPPQTPFPDWLDEERAAAALADSHKRRLLGRW